MGATDAHDKLFDTHAHFFSRDLDRYPIDVSKAREGAEKAKARVLADPMTPERIFGMWDDAGVTGGAAVQYNTVYRTNNSYILDLSKEHADRISAVVILRADLETTPSLLEKMAERWHVNGLRLFGYPDEEGNYPWLDSYEALRTWEVVDRLGINVVIMYAPASNSLAALDRIGTLATRYPNTSISLDHFGWPSDKVDVLGIEEPLLSLQELTNISFKLSTINYHQFDKNGIDSAQFVRKAADIFGADRMMWGSDVGNTLDDYGDMAERARASARLLDEDERRLFLHDTGSRIFGPEKA